MNNDEAGIKQAFEAWLPEKLNAKYALLLNEQSRYLILYGGAGSGKSVFAAQKALWRCVTEEDAMHRILCIRKYRSTIRNSIFSQIKELIYAYGLIKLVKINKTELGFYFSNGNEIITAGVDDPEKLKSIAGITSIWLEEPTELDKADFDQIDLRLRGQSNPYKQIVFTFNPVSETHWLKKEFFDTQQNDSLSVHCTYQDNRFIDEAYIRVLEQRIKHDENLYRVYVKGEWGTARTGAEFYKAFQYNRHTTRLSYHAAYPLHISFDFNAQPYCTLTIWQVNVPEWKDKYPNLKYIAGQIDEICAESPYNHTRGVCSLFMERYGKHEAGVLVYGDPAGRHADTRGATKGGDYALVLDALDALKPNLKVSGRTFPVRMRGNFINAILSGNEGGIGLLWDVQCLRSIDDYLHLKEDADGTKLKAKVYDREKGLNYEKYGHCSDANDYLLCTLFSQAWENYRGGGPLLPRSIGRKPQAHNRY